MKRRDFIGLLGRGVAAWPLAAVAQQAAMPVVGFLNAQSARDYRRQLAVFLDGLAEAGYVDGRNVKIEYRWAENHSDRLPALMVDLLDRKPGGHRSAQHTRRARGEGREHDHSDRLRNRI